LTLTHFGAQMKQKAAI